MSLNKSLLASRIDHRVRWITQKIRRPATAVAGGYHSGNLGDMALAYSAKGQVAKRIHAGGRIGIQTIYNLPDWPRAKKVVVGGGALLGSNAIKSLKEYTNNQPMNVGIIGVDFSKGDIDEEDVDFLKGVSFLSFRSEFSLEAAQNKYSLNNARLSPDIVFARDETIFASVAKFAPAPKALAINITPGLGRDHSRTKAEDRRLYSNYIRWVRAVTAEYLQAGYSVESIPFTHADERAARENLSDLPIKHNPYTHNVITVLSRIQRCDTFICSRYHALIFGCLLEKKIIPFCYARKNYALCEKYLHLPSNGFRELEQSSEPEKTALTLEPSILQELRILVHREFDDLYNALFS
ncbi:MAG: polysaccharide pyruvyl transferase family protein [Spiribacter salinus]|uniref:Polysaccharide pyruvyl transferase family protein n=1 Tax=Spiribacter salinus TaxID=1335746 RepID=A0A540VAV3_9GAMM|nr:MAG: polysaccharide pyruvyl transferase family protein [Spiribacter salinus]